MSILGGRCKWSIDMEFIPIPPSSSNVFQEDCGNIPHPHLKDEKPQIHQNHPEGG